MARDFKLSVVAPDRSVVESQVSSVVLPGQEGYFGVMAGHVPLIAALKAGLLEYQEGPSRHYVYVGGGFAEVRADKVTVLADEAQAAREIDVSRTEAQLEQARRALRGEASEMTYDQAVEDVERAMQRLRAARASR